MVANIDLDTPLIEFPVKGQPSTYFTVRNAVEGVQIFGGIGSGKTSGSGAMFARKYLKAGFGGLVLSVKEDEKTSWENYCREAGRTDDLIILEAGGKHTFNFLEYESWRGNSSSYTENIVQVLKTVIRASEEKSGKPDDPFWETALDMLMFNIIDLCQLAYGKVSLRKIYDIAESSPNKSRVIDREENTSNAFETAYRRAQANVMPLFEAWKGLFTESELKQMEAAGTYDAILQDEIPELRTMAFIDQFFSETFYNLSEKTRSIVDFSFTGFLFRLLKEPFYSLFSRNASTFNPEDCLKGKIILLHLPVKLFDKVGRDSQILFKYIWQRAMERRKIGDNSRPVFLWADEAQHFLHEHDAEYQATARSSLIATVYLSQNIPNYYANMGGNRSEHRVKSFLGTLGTKLFHANADIDTNKYASDLFGEVFKEEPSRQITISGDIVTSEGLSYRLEKLIRPEEFVALKTGGEPNNYKTEVFMHRQGKATQSVSELKKIFNQKSKI